MRIFTFKSYAAKITAFIIVCNLMIQIMFSLVISVSYCNKNRELSLKLTSSQIENYKKNFDYFVSYLERYMDVLLQNKIFDYVNTPVNLLKGQQQDDRIIEEGVIKDNKYGLRYIERSFVIGADNNYRSFIIKPEGATYEEKNTINLYNLISYGVIEYLNFNVDRLFRFDAGKIHWKNRPNAEPTTLGIIDSFVKELDGKIVYCIYSYNSLIVLVIDDAWFEEAYNPKNIRTNLNFVLLDKEMKPLYTTMKINDMEIISKNVLVENGKLGCTLMVNTIKNHMNLYPYIFYVGVVLAFFFFMTLVSFYAKYYSRSITKPYKCINNIIKFHYQDNPLNAIDISAEDVLHKSNISISIYKAILLTIVLPSIVAGSFYSIWLTFFSKKDHEDYLSFVKHQMVVNMVYETDFLFEPASFITSLQYDNVKLYYNIKKTYNEIIQYPNSVVWDSKFNVIYDPGSVMSKKVSYQNRETIKRKVEKMDQDVFITSAIDDGNNKAIFIVKKIKTNKNCTKGYYLIYVQDSLYDNIQVDTIVDFVLVNEEDKIVAYDNNAFDYGDYDKTSFLKKYQSNYRIEKEYIPYMGWEFYTVCKNEIYMLDSNRLMLISFLCVFIILSLVLIILWRLSFFFVSPLDLMKVDMANKRKGVKLFNKYNTDYDEIVEVINTYNKMIKNISNLIEEKTQLISINAKSEMRALQHQINPHFLYNTLEILNFQALSIKNYEMSETIVQLTHLFRYVLSNPSYDAFLRDEINHAKCYAAIQEKRFNGSIRHIWNIQEEILDYRVIKLLLQPLIENCISHGLEEVQGGGTVTVSIYTSEEHLFIEVTDDGVGMTEEELQRVLTSISSKEEITKLGGLALKNIYRRLKLYYGDGGDLQINSKFMEGTTVKLVIPLNKLQEERNAGAYSFV